MKNLTLKVTLLLVAFTMAFTACKKDETEDVESTNTTNSDNASLIVGTWKLTKEVEEYAEGSDYYNNDLQDNIETEGYPLSLNTKVYEGDSLFYSKEVNLDGSVIYSHEYSEYREPDKLTIYKDGTFSWDSYGYYNGGEEYMKFTNQGYWTWFNEEKTLINFLYEDYEMVYEIVEISNYVLKIDSDYIYKRNDEISYKEGHECNFKRIQ